MIVQVQLKDAKHQVQEDLGSKNRNLYTTILQTQTLEILLIITPPPSSCHWLLIILSINFLIKY